MNDIIQTLQGDEIEDFFLDGVKPTNYGSHIADLPFFNLPQLLHFLTP